MRTSIVAFALGVWFCQRQPMLPDPQQWAAMLATALALLAAAYGLRHRVGVWATLLPGCALAGFVFASGAAMLRLSDALAAADEGRDIVVTGVVASLPQRLDRGLRFEFEVEQAAVPVPRRLWIAWYAPRGGDRTVEVHAGERWRLTLRLKRPHGNLNPHGFDYEAWLFERHLRATGYVRDKAQYQRLDAMVGHPDYAIARLREAIRDRFETVLGDAPYGGLLVALAIGDQRAIPAAQWLIFNRSGTTHLMSISGLHVTMIAALGHMLLAAIWRRIPGLALRMATPRAATCAGWLCAFFYALLAGFGVPAQRTLYMLSVVALALLANRRIGASRILALALLVVLLADPWAVLSAGFWLSFGAVGLLLFGATGRLGSVARWRQFLAAQWAVTLGMIPAMLALFQQFSLASPLANAVAIPAVSLLVTPLALLGAVLPLEFVLWLAHGALWLLLALLKWLAASPLAVWQQAAPPAWAVLSGLAGCLVILLPRGIPARWLGAVLLLPLLTAAAARPEPGAARLTILDVGQGLAVHVQTAGHDLIYDTGPQFSDEIDSGNRTILPYLRAQGVARIDALVLSHDDTDHAGGAASLIAGVPVGWMLHGLPPDHPLLRLGVVAKHCVSGQRWQWDGVEFEVLHPAAGTAALRSSRGNNGSCVLRLSAGGRAVLLTGDIEARAERELLAAGAEGLAAELIVVPHHGSRSSSTVPFVAAVGARVAAFSVGYRSRFGHPHATVLARYAGARILRTDHDGALTVSFDRAAMTLERERERRRRYWHNEP